MATVAAPPARDRSAAYDVVGLVGGGALTEVLLAVERGPLGFERRVVLKRPRAALPPPLAAKAEAAIAREARVYARLVHPAIVRLYSFETIDRRPTLVLEHVEGTSLDRLMTTLEARGEALDDASALFLGQRIFLALAAAHRAYRPVIHGDVCPANVLVPWDGHLKLVDFGGSLGTASHHVPEQERTDVHAACLVMRALLDRAVRLKAPPASVVAALRRGLDPDPQRRTLSAEEMARTIRRVLDVEAARELLVGQLEELRHTVGPPPASGVIASRGDDEPRVPASMVVPSKNPRTLARRSKAARPTQRLNRRAALVGIAVGGVCSAALLAHRPDPAPGARPAVTDAMDAGDAAVNR